MHTLTSYETEKSYSDSILAYSRGKYYEGPPAIPEIYKRFTSPPLLSFGCNNGNFLQKNDARLTAKHHFYFIYSISFFLVR